MSAFGPEQEDAFVSEGNRVYVSSSNVEYARYDRAAQRLRIKFLKSSVVYSYRDVPEDVARDFARAPSKGTWVSAVLVRPGWPFDKE